MLPEVLTQYEAAQALGVTEPELTWARDRRCHESDPSACPPFVRFGRSIRFLLSSMCEWANEHGRKLADADPDPRYPVGVRASELPTIITDYQARSLVRLSEREWRARRKRCLDGDATASPAWIKEGRAVCWRLEDVLDWLKLHERDETLSESIAARSA